MHKGDGLGRRARCVRIEGIERIERAGAGGPAGAGVGGTIDAPRRRIELVPSVPPLHRLVITECSS